MHELYPNRRFTPKKVPMSTLLLEQMVTSITLKTTKKKENNNKTKLMF